MRTLEQALIDHDLLTLRIIGEWWELDLTGADKASCVQSLATRLAALNIIEELKFIDTNEAAAVEALARAGGRIPVSAFRRQHGEVRQMGQSRLEREEPWLDPVSPAEGLWYKGFLFQGFDEADEGLVEFFYLPEEIAVQFPAPETTPEAQPTTLTPVPPPEQTSLAGSSAVDDLTTLLAFAQRDGLTAEGLAAVYPYLQNQIAGRAEWLLALGVELDYLRRTDNGLKPSRSSVDWLKEGRETQLRLLADAWQTSSWNELCHTPGLRCAGSGWSNDPILARRALLAALPHRQVWFSLDALTDHIQETNPDFQRPGGNYDTWYILDVARDAYLTGFESWSLVEGRLLRYLVQGPLHWLGMVDLGENCYRLTEQGVAWLTDAEPAGRGVEVPLVVQADASLLVPHNAGRYQRFQAARVADPRPYTAGKPYLYQITPQSLLRAQEAGIGPQRVVQFLEKAGQRKIPASTRRAIERWQEKGMEGRLEQVVILRVRDAAILETLQNNPKTQPYLGERLGDLAVIVNGQDWGQLQHITAQLGLLLDLVE